MLRVARGVARPLHAAVRADDALHEASTRNEHPVDAADDAMIHDQQPRRLGKRQPKQRQLQESLRDGCELASRVHHRIIQKLALRRITHAPYGCCARNLGALSSTRTVHGRWCYATS